MKNGLIRAADGVSFARKAVGFTLVELLVVIAILSILSGLLMPVLSSARKSAHSIACINNLKQCGSAENMYADDHGDFFPFAAPPGSASPRCFHLAAIINYLQVPKDTVLAKKGSQVCPSFVNPFTVDVPEMRLWYNPTSGNNFYYSYAGTHYANSADPYGTSPARRSRYRSPSQTLLLTDGTSQTVYRYVQRFYVIHLGGFNNAWVDGHVTHVKTPYPDETDIALFSAPDKYFYQKDDTTTPPWGEQK